MPRVVQLAAAPDAGGHNTRLGESTTIRRFRSPLRYSGGACAVTTPGLAMVIVMQLSTTPGSVTQWIPQQVTTPSSATPEVTNMVTTSCSVKPVASQPPATPGSAVPRVDTGDATQPGDTDANARCYILPPASREVPTLGLVMPKVTHAVGSPCSATRLATPAVQTQAQ